MPNLKCHNAVKTDPCNKTSIKNIKIRQIRVNLTIAPKCHSSLPQSSSDSEWRPSTDSSLSSNQSKNPARLASDDPILDFRRTSPQICRWDLRIRRSLLNVLRRSSGVKLYRAASTSAISLVVRE